MFGTTLVGVDGAEGGLDAVALARVLARPGGDVLLVHVGADDRRHHGRDSDAALAEAETALGRGGAGAVRRCPVHASGVPEGLRSVALQELADVIVVGSHHRQGLGRVWSRDHAGATLREAPCPVAIAPRGFRDRPADPLRVIGVGFDDTASAMMALLLARRLARRSGAAIHAIWVVDRSNWPDADTARGRNAVRATRRLAEIDGIEGITVEGDADAAWHELADFSRRVDVLVLGSHHHRLLHRIVVGNTVRGLVRRAACPILILPSA